MLNVHNLSVSFQGEYLFEEVAFMLNAGDRVGLIGKNGAGKSTMLKLLSRELKPDSGTIAADKDVRIGFLKQDIDFVKGRTILEEAYQAFGEIKTLEQKLDDIHHQIETRTDYESESYHNLLDMLSDYTHRFDLIGGYQYQGETEKVLLGLGFQRSDFDKLTDSFSGGWRMRIELAKLLLQNNDILLLDEPTNHLDIKSKNVLKKALQQFEGTLIIVSHDRDFLQGLTDKVYEFKNKNIKEYLGDIDFYLEQRAVANFREMEQQKETVSAPTKAAANAEKLSFEQQKQQKAAQNKLNKIENQIAALEEEVKQMDMQMGQGVQSNDYYKEYEQKKKMLEELMTEWENLMS